ncbi:MAG: polysaccharide deacetylase family protein [Candidatus Omnitrophica bacterium]|nr:polysaccharide deacetylase family protein [Candidatus Omnitrophota bacterium]
MKKILLSFSLFILSLIIFYFFWFSPKYTVPILMYHNIGYEKGSFYVSPENFAKQMEYIKKNGYEVITLNELVTNIRGKKPFKRNKVVITFDDGYRDNYEYAFGILKKFSFPATIFIISDFVGKDFTSGKEFLNWEQIILMSQDKISFGAHTKTHFNFGSQMDSLAAQEEIAGSKKAIEEKTKLPVDYFCYPSGGFNEKAKELVKQAGFKGACSTNRGFAKFNSDEYELKRIKVTNSDMTKPFSFYVKLSGFYNVFKRSRNSY